MKRNCIIFLLLVIFIFQIFPQDDNDLGVRINQIIDDNYPNIVVYLSVFLKSSQEPLTTVTTGSFTTFIDNKQENSKPKKEIFRITEDPISYYIVLSADGVMILDPDVLDKQIQGVRYVYENMQQDKDIISLIVNKEEPEILFQYEQDEDTIVEALDKIEIVMGDTSHLYDSILDAARLMDEEAMAIDTPITRKAMILVTDGRDQGSTFSGDKFYDKISDYNFPIYTVGFTIIEGEYLDAMQDLSKNTGGNYLFVNSMNEIPGTIETFQNQIVNSYILKYKIRAIRGDNDFHELRIRVETSDGSAQATKIFYAKKGKINIIIIIVIIVIVVLLLVGLFFLILIQRRSSRAKIGITKRKCPDCKRRMKDDWDECMFCKYLPKKKKKDRD